MYQDFIVVLNIGKSIEEIVQEVGGIQGDNMATVLFLFLVAAFDEILEKIWEENFLKYWNFNKCPKTI